MRGKSRKIILPALSGALGLVLALGWWFVANELDTGPIHISGSQPGYKSIESLSRAADVVVIGTVKRVAGREPYYTGYGSGDIGIPSVFYEVEVNETLQGNPGDTIIVAQIDNAAADVIVSDSGSALNIGERLALFLAHRAGDEYGLKEFGDIDNLYVIVSNDNGIFDVSADEVATPRAPYMFRTPGSPDMPTFTLDEIRAGVAVNDLPSGSDDDNAPGGLLEEPPPSASPISVN